MNRYLLLTLMCLTSGVLFGQKTEKKVYTMKPDENFIFRDEHRLYFTANGSSSILFTEVKKGEDSQHFGVLNWQTTKAYDEIYYPETFMAEAHGRYNFVAKRDDKLWVNDNGTEYGPFDEVNPAGNSAYHLLQNNKGQLAFAGKMGDTWTVYFDGKPYKAFNETNYRFNKFELNYADDGSFSYISVSDGKFVLNVNGREAFRAEEIGDFRLGSNGRFCTFATVNGRVVVFTEKKQYGPWEQSGYAGMDSKGNFCYTYLRDNAWYAVTNTAEYGPYDEISQYYGVKYEDDGNFWFGFKRGDNWYLNISGTEYKGGDDYGMYAMTSGKNIAYAYKDKNMQYVVVNGKTFGPYQALAWTDNNDLYKVKFAANGSYIFAYRESDKEHVMINGKATEAYENIKKAYIDAKGWYSFRYGQDGIYGVNIAGKTYGPYLDMTDTYDTIKTDQFGRFAIAGTKQDAKSQIISHNNLVEVNGNISYLIYGVDGTVGFIAAEAEDAYRVYVGANKFGPYTSASELNIANARNYSFYNQDGFIVNGQPSNMEFFVSSESGNNLLTASESEVYINGKLVDNGSCFWFVYNKQKQMFVWFKLVGSDIVEVNFTAP